MSATRIHPAYDDYRRARDEKWTQDYEDLRDALASLELRDVDLNRGYLAEARKQIEHISWANVEWISRTRNIQITVSLTIEGSVYGAASIHSPTEFVYAMDNQSAGPPYTHRTIRSLCYQAMGGFSNKELSA